MTTSSELRAATRPGEVLARGLDARQFQPARLDADLRTTAFIGTRGADPRLFDPRLEVAVAHAAALAEEEGRQAGYLAGYLAGEQSGRLAAQETARRQEQARNEREAEAQRDRQEQLAAALRELQAAAADLLARELPVVEQLETMSAGLAVDLAEALVGHHLTVGECAAGDAVARALDLAPQGAAATVRLHPDDAATFATDASGLAGRSVTVVADASLQVGDCVVDCGARRIDARLAPAVQRLREVLAA